MTPPAPAGRQNVKSLLKMLEVLECFSSAEPALSVIEIARATGLPRTTVHRIVDSLRLLGFIEQDGSRERYRLGIKLFALGNTALSNLPLYREAGPFVDTLSKLSGEVVHLYVFDGTQMLVIETAGAVTARPRDTVTTIEATPCHCTGVGKAALAFQDEAAIERVIRLGLPRFTPNTITLPDALRRDLAATRARGYAIDEAEHEPDRRCVAAPIRNAAGRVFAAISVTGPMRRVTPERVAALAALVVSHADQISARLGHVARPGQALAAE